jgi:AraC-like DNA-binding protein
MSAITTKDGREIDDKDWGLGLLSTNMSELPDARASARHTAAIKPILALLASHVAEAPSFGQLAAMAGMSRWHFSRTFHAVVGVPLRRYLSDLRLKRACELLETSTLSLTTIAQECGFYDLPHLDKAFRRRFGISPNAFRHCGHAEASAPRVRPGGRGGAERSVRVARTLARLRGGDLLAPPVGGTVLGGWGEGKPCDGCQEIIAPTHVEYEIAGAVVLRFHPECWRAWRAAGPSAGDVSAIA